MGGCCSSRNDVWDGLNYREDEDEEEFFEAEDDVVRMGDGGACVRLKGSCRVASMFSQQGWKGVNQDAMTIWEDYAGDKDKIFCAVFDGHGTYGHRVACHVRDALPSNLYNKMRLLPSSLKCTRDLDANGDINGATSNHDGAANDHGEECISSWKENIVKTFNELDDVLKHHPNIDTVCSGATAVSIIRERDHLIITNLGDSRAVLCTRNDRRQLVPVQLTVDLKPNLPSEAERIKRCNGRVFALREEPDVHRLWLPDDDSPGLAMARAFGDFCLKDFGLISTPQVSYRKLTEKDEFVVLATDGIWDVLSNKEVIKIVSSANKRSDAAKLVVDRAVRAWRIKHPSSRIDDCTVVCLFFKVPSSSAKPAVHTRSNSDLASEISTTESFRTAASEDVQDPPHLDDGMDSTKEQRTGLEGDFNGMNPPDKLPQPDNESDCNETAKN